jgi:hypothetical protein
MSDSLSIFGSSEPEQANNPYRTLGYPRNPFRAQAGESLEGSIPLYDEHIRQQLADIDHWLVDVHQRQVRDPLSVVGGIGTGKTHLLRLMRQRLDAAASPRQRVAADLLLLGDAGYSRASIGQLLVLALERMRLPWVASVPEGVFPLLWGILSTDYPPRPSAFPSRLAPTLHHIRTVSAAEKEQRARLVTRWLQRAQLSETEARRVGLSRRIDWEGELIPVVAELFALGRAAGVLDTFFLLIDQLEELFRPVFTELRRSRLLTDLRGLVDYIDSGAPIGLALAWTPDFHQPISTNEPGEVEQAFQQKYEALFSRLQRRRITLPLLAQEHAEPFSRRWIDSLKGQEGFESARQPNPTELVGTAWKHLRSKKQLYPGERATPRDLLAILADEVDRRALPR